MTVRDLPRAFGVALLVMALDFACAFAFVFLWVQINQPDRPLAMMDPKTIALSTLSTRMFGPILFALCIWVFSRRRPQRNAWAFAGAVFAFYALVDWSLVGFQGVFLPAALATMALKLAGAMTGAWLARRGARTA
jgi:hypothetical protein